MNHLFLDEMRPECLTRGRTVLLPKDPQKVPFDYRPITCLRVKTRLTNLWRAKTDCKKAYDYMPHTWILKCLQLCKISRTPRAFIRNVVNNTRSQFSANSTSHHGVWDLPRRCWLRLPTMKWSNSLPPPLHGWHQPVYQEWTRHWFTQLGSIATTLECHSDWSRTRPVWGSPSKRDFLRTHYRKKQKHTTTLSYWWKMYHVNQSKNNVAILDIWLFRKRYRKRVLRQEICDI